MPATPTGLRQDKSAIMPQSLSSVHIHLVLSTKGHDSSVKEQQTILNFITDKDTEFRTVATQIERQVDTLTAYRKSLIDECVTGQRRITEADVRRAQNKRSPT